MVDSRTLYSQFVGFLAPSGKENNLIEVSVAKGVYGWSPGLFGDL